jgi:hypothetical protein
LAQEQWRAQLGEPSGRRHRGGAASGTVCYRSVIAIGRDVVDIENRHG